MILGASIAIQNNYDVFTAATTKACILNSFVFSGKPLLGMIDGVNVAYLDPQLDSTQSFLDEQLPKFYDSVGGFEGLYLQDTHLPNEVSGEVDQKPPAADMNLVKGRRLDYGEETLGGYEPYQINETQANISTYFLPYMPTSDNLNDFTVSLNVTQGVNQVNHAAKLFVQNVNGHATLQKFTTTLKKEPKTSNVKPLLFTESTFPGSGAYAAGLITN